VADRGGTFIECRSAVRTKLLAVSTYVLGVALALPALAVAGDGGFAPQTPASPDEQGVRDTYWLILGFTGAIFVLVAGSLLLFMIRFRSRGRPYEQEGPQIRGNTRLELAWTAAPVLILAAIAAFVFYKLPVIDNPSAAADASSSDVDITVKGYRFYWLFSYPNGVLAVDTMHVPVGRVVNLTITTAPEEVQHSWWIPKLGGKRDAIPGRINHLQFRADKPGTYVGQCAEFCGIQHAAMLAKVIAMPAADYDQWLSQQGASQSAKNGGNLGEQEWHGACSKCHGPEGQGYIGPAIKGNPLLSDPQGLGNLIRNGQGEMPPVGVDWSDKQVNALVAYTSKNLGSGGGTGPLTGPPSSTGGNGSGG
jgi:cytochrome c oxidase subunit II